MSSKFFVRVDVLFSESQTEVSNSIDAVALENFNCCGIEDYCIDEAKVDSILGDRAFSGGDIPESLLDEVSANISSGENWQSYFFTQDDEQSANSFFDYLHDNFPTIATRIYNSPVLDWNEEWRKSYVPIEVNQNLLIVPEWMKDQFPESLGKTILYIYPGQGFGTGGHETTFLCLKIFSELYNDFDKDTCLDLGCGSGILGIAAIKYGYEKVVFCDIDKPAMENCVQNLFLNFENQDLSGHQVIDRKKLTTGDTYSLIFANILESALMHESSFIVDSLKSGGVAILSGILNHQAEGLITYFSHQGLKLHCQESKGDWTALGFKK